MLLIEADRERYSDEGKPPVEWESYLELAPSLAALDPQARPDALAERALDADAWTRAESYWALTFALDLQQGRTDRVDAFGRACAEALGARPGPAAPAAPVAPRRTSGPPDPDRTGEIVASRVAPTLPFGRARSPEYAARWSAPAPMPPPPRADRPDATVMGAVRASAPVLPFPSSTPAASSLVLPDLTVEQHAMLSAEISLLHDGPSRAAALARYGVDGTPALTALGARWKERLQVDPAAAARWKAVYTEHQKAHARKPR